MKRPLYWLLHRLTDRFTIPDTGGGPSRITTQDVSTSLRAADPPEAMPNLLEWLFFNPQGCSERHLLPVDRTSEKSQPRPTPELHSSRRPSCAQRAQHPDAARRNVITPPSRTQERAGTGAAFDMR